MIIFLNLTINKSGIKNLIKKKLEINERKEDQKTEHPIKLPKNQEIGIQKIGLVMYLLNQKKSLKII